MSAEFEFDVALATVALGGVRISGVAACLRCAESAPRLCHEHYRLELEPTDETVAELQSLVVAMRHREGEGPRAELVTEMFTLARLLAGASNPVDQIRHSMALAAVAIRYREDITP